MITYTVTKFDVSPGFLDIQCWGAQGSFGVERLHFDLSSDWGGLAKYLVVGGTTKILLDANNEVVVPVEATTNSGTQIALLVGYADGKRILTQQIWYEVAATGDISTLEDADPTPTIYQQVLDMMVQQATDALAAQEAQAAAEAAEQGAQDAQAEAEAAQGLAESAKSDAQGYANDAGLSADAADQAAILANNNILNGVSTHNASDAAHLDIRLDVDAAKAIAQGRARSLVFDTYAQLAAWVAGTYERADGLTTADLLVGDNLYIVDLGVPDYWWTGTGISELEAESPALVDYYTKAQVAALLPIIISRTDYDALVAAGTVQADRLYDVYEV